MANGNCLYNACSIALTGNDHRISGILRCLTSIELYEHAPYYANHPVVKSQHENGAFTSLKNAFAMCLSDTALSAFEKYDSTAAVVEEAKHNAHNYEFSWMMCMFALATVIDCTIQSYYPITNDSAQRQDWDSLAKMFNCSIYPRQFLDGDFLENVHIFRCAAMPQRYLVDREIPTRKNHFVTLCQPIDDVEPGEHYFLPKFPMLPPPPKAIDGHAGPSSISKLMPIGTKRKQLSLDLLLPKKKVNDKEEPMITSSSSTNETTDNNSIKSGNFEVKLITNTTSSTAVNTGCPKDINNYINRVSTFSDAEKYELLSNAWKPVSDYTFPPDKNSGRRFQYSWLSRFPWLVYSAAANGGFCINCVLLGGESTHNASKLQRLMTLPLIPSSSATQKLIQHAQKSKVHETATIRASEFRRMMERKSTPTDVQLNNARQELIEKNRMRLSTIIGAILTCGRQNIALRGHRDDSQYYVEDDTTNPGNFIEIVKYGARCGNLMDEMFKDCPSNQTYR